MDKKHVTKTKDKEKNPKLKVNKNANKDKLITTDKSNKLLTTSFLVVFMTCLIVAISIIIFMILLHIGVSEAMQSLTNTIANYSDIKFEEYNTFADRDLIGSGEKSNIATTGFGNDIASALRDVIYIRNDLNEAYYIDENNKVFEITKNYTKQVDNDNDVYKYLYDFKNGNVTEELSPWILDESTNEYLRLIVKNIKQNGENIGVFAISYKPTLTSSGFSSFIDIFDDMKMQLVANDKIIYENNVHSVAEKVEKEKENSNHLMKVEKAESTQKKKEFFDKLSNFYFGFINSFKDDEGPLTTVVSSAKKTGYDIVIKYNELLKQSKYDILFTSIIIVILYAVGVYIYVNTSKKDKKSHFNIICMVSIIVIFITTVLTIVNYSISYEKARGKQLLGDGMLLQVNGTSSYNIDKILESIVKSIPEGTVIDDNYVSIVKQELMGLLGAAFADSNIESANMTFAFYTDDVHQETRKTYDVFKTDIAINGETQSRLSPDEKTLRVIKYFVTDNTSNNIQMISKLEIVANKDILKLDIINNDRKPTIICKIGSRTYDMTKDIIKETKDIYGDVKFDEYNEVLGYKISGMNAVIKLQDNNIGLTSYLAYHINTTSVEWMFQPFAIILEILGVIIILYLRKHQTFDDKEIAKVDPYGNIVYYKQDELLKNRELASLNQDELEEVLTVDISNIIKKRRALNRRALDQTYDEDESTDKMNKVYKDELKILQVFKSNKEIFDRYSKDQKEKDKKYYNQHGHGGPGGPPPGFGGPGGPPPGFGSPGGPPPGFGQDMMTSAYETDARDNMQPHENMTLGEALDMFKNAKLTKKDINRKNENGDNEFNIVTDDNDTYEQSEYDEKLSEQFLQSSKDEEFGKMLLQKYKDTKK